MPRSSDEHYTSELVRGARSRPGAGLVAWITGDQLHPPMLFESERGGDGTKGANGVRRYVLELGNVAELQPNEHILDIGSGVCGPARLLVDAFGIRVTAITNSRAHAETSERLNEVNDGHKSKIRVKLVSGTDDWPEAPYNVAWTLNMRNPIMGHEVLYRQCSD